MRENVAEANAYLAVFCVYSTSAINIQRTYIYLHNQEAQKSCHLGSHVDNKMIIKTMYIVDHSSEKLQPFSYWTLCPVYSNEYVYWHYVCSHQSPIKLTFQKEKINYSYSTKA